jgi:hypothetical protein
MSQASPSHDDKEARPLEAPVDFDYPICLLVEVKRSPILRCGNFGF